MYTCNTECVGAVHNIYHYYIRLFTLYANSALFHSIVI